MKVIGVSPPVPAFFRGVYMSTCTYRYGPKIRGLGNVTEGALPFPLHLGDQHCLWPRGLKTGVELALALTRLQERLHSTLSAGGGDTHLRVFSAR